jgi:hypothetical protein
MELWEVGRNPKADWLCMSVTRHASTPPSSAEGDTCVERVRGREAAAVMVEVISTGLPPLVASRAQKSRCAWVCVSRLAKP